MNGKYSCGHDDCFSCPFDDCICDDIDKPWHRYDEARKRAEKKRGEKRKAQRLVWLEQGLCTHCGATLPDEKYRMCPKCRARARKYKEREYRRRGITSPSMKEYLGLCKRCGKNPPIEGKKLCEDCYAIAVKGIEHARLYSGGRKVNNDFTKEVDSFWATFKWGNQ